MKPIGPTFNAELQAAGLTGLPFSWGNDGVIQFGALTPEQIAAVQAVYEAHDPSRGVPDIKGFTQALVVAMGGVVAANTLLRAYPAFYAALNTQNWADVQALITDAKLTGALTQQQYDGMKQIAQQFNIPLTLP